MESKYSSTACEVCKSQSTLKCASCCSVYYCTKEHQTEHWKMHKKSCFALTLAENEELGRHFVASRNIKAGSLILKELPIICGPLASDDRLSKCIGCCVFLKEGIGLGPGKSREGNCINCGWPVCSMQCPSVLEHHSKYECAILKERRIICPPTGLDKAAVCNGIQLLRGMAICKKNPTVWRELMNLKSQNNATLSMGPQKAVENIAPALYGLLKMSEESLDDCIRLLGIINVNGMGTSRTEFGNEYPSLFSALYLKGSLIAHGCISNATRQISYSPKFELHMRAAVDIQKGQIITMNYYNETKFYGTELRLARTMEASGFQCQCIRCMDRTELGTYSSAIKCTSKTCSNDGYMLPIAFHDLNSPYVCGRCGKKSNRKVVKDLIAKLHKTLSESETIDCVKKDAKELEAFISTNKRILHPNHWLLQEAARGCLMAYHDTIKTNPTHLDRFLVHGRYLVGIFDKLHPGLSDPRIPAMLQVIQGMALDVKQGQQNKSISIEEVHRKWAEINTWATECLEYEKVEVQTRHIPTGCTQSKECTFLAKLITESIIIEQHKTLGQSSSISKQQQLNLTNSVFNMF